MQLFTYKKPEDIFFAQSVYTKRAPGMAVRSIFRRLLRETNNETFEVKLIVKNLNNGKLYYYDCRAIYNPTQKLVSNFKYLTIKYEINIIKLNERCF